MERRSGRRVKNRRREKKGLGGQTPTARKKFKECGNVREGRPITWEDEKIMSQD